MRRLGIALLAASAAMGQDQISDRALEKAKQLTVMINATIDGDTRPGAGIIFGLANDQVYIATANHLVRRRLSKAGDIQVEFQWLPGQPVPAQLLAYYDDRALDLAVIVVERAKARLGQAGLPLDRLGDWGTLSRGSAVSAIGYPNGTAYDVSAAQISQVEAVLLKYRVPGLVPGGYSGGPLVNGNGMIVGMIRQDQPPDGEATRIGLVVDQLKAWNYQVALQFPGSSQPRPEAQPPVEVPAPQPLSSTGAANPFKQVLLRMVAEGPSGFRALGAPQSGSGIWKPAVVFPDALECHGLYDLERLGSRPIIECQLFRSKDRAAAVSKILEFRQQIDTTLPAKVWERDERTWSTSSDNMYMRFINGPLEVSLVFLGGSTYNVVIDVRGVRQ